MVECKLDVGKITRSRNTILDRVSDLLFFEFRVNK